MVSDSKEVSDLLAEHFSKISSEESFGQDFRDSANEREYPDFHTHNSEYYNIPFTMKELRHALQHTKNSSPGEDTIFAEMVKKLPSNAQEALLKIYNDIWEADFLLRFWRTAFIIPIAKPGKYPKLTTSYRPIDLTSILLKIFEGFFLDTKERKCFMHGVCDSQRT